MSDTVALVAVSSATYWLDKPYAYSIPIELISFVKIGARVNIPFSSSNHVVEGFVLKFFEEYEGDIELKSIISVIDSVPLITHEQIKLAFFMRERFFATIYDSLKAMVPAGAWLRKQNYYSRNKVQKVYSLIENDISIKTYIDAKCKSAPQQSAILKLLIEYGELCENDILSHSGSSKASLNSLVKKNLVIMKEYECESNISAVYDIKALPILNFEQEKAFLGIKDKICLNSFSCNLLFGITGSGKTSVYSHLINYTISIGKSVLFLLPEIGLTPQIMKLFRSYFGNNVAILHSSLSVSERYSEWLRIKNGDAQIVIGTRSAIFAPLSNLGLIIIDEEHDGSYKSDSNPRYNTKYIAKYLCYSKNACLVLGSATPSIETMYEVEKSVTSLFKLNTRYNNSSLPTVLFADMKKELVNGNISPISSLLCEEIQKNIDNGEQTILFVNRRGTNKLITCNECGYIYQCHRCSVSLSFHSDENKLICHYCGHTETISENCPNCGNSLSFLGFGTQKIVEEIVSKFPGKDYIRVDSDTVSKVGSHQVLFNKFVKEKIPFLIGTQMVSKGLNFDDVTLVGVLDADHMLYSGNYKASEDSFSTITQVIGRSGRSNKPGRAVIQTYTPENPVLRLASKQDYESFYSSEITFRKLHNAPPIVHLYSIVIVGKKELDVLNACSFLRSFIHNKTASIRDISILGPAPLPIYKLNNYFRYRINILCNDTPEIRRLISNSIIETNLNKKYRGVQVYADNNPTI